MNTHLKRKKGKVVLTVDGEQVLDESNYDLITVLESLTTYQLIALNYVMSTATHTSIMNRIESNEITSTNSIKINSSNGNSNSSDCDGTDFC